MSPARLASAAALAVLLAACGQGDPDAVLETVRLTEKAQQEAFAARDLAGVVRVYTDDATVMMPGGIHVRGPGTIGAAFTDLLADPNLAIEVEPETEWAAASGDLAVTNSIGRITVTDPESGEAMTVPVSNQTVWTKRGSPTWQIVSERIVASDNSAQLVMAAE